VHCAAISLAHARVKKRFFKRPNPVGFIGFLDKQEKIGKIIQKLGNLNP